MGDNLFQFSLFCADPDLAKKAALAKIDMLIIDWECSHKKARQKGYDTEINRHTVSDLRRVASAVDIPVICRINPFGDETQSEIAAAIENGAFEILMPMVRTLEEVETVLGWVKGKCKVSILIETLSAVQLTAQLSALPLSRIYVGLNDLHIEMREKNLFSPLANGLLEKIRNQVTLPFGFGGLTLPHLGSPIPCQLLIDEMARLKCSFSFLRRSFLKDVPVEKFADAIVQIRSAYAKAKKRKVEQIALSHEELLNKVRSYATG